MTGSTVFVCYSHQDEKEKDRLLVHLDVLQKNVGIDLWSEDRTGPGADWQAEIDRAIVEARIAILFITADFLRSDFLIDKVVPTLVKRREQEGLIIFPVIAKACAWRSVDWLVKMKVRPENGNPIWSAPADYYIDEALAKVAEEVASIVKVGKSDEALASGIALLSETDIIRYRSGHEESHKAEIEVVSPQEEAVLRSIADRTNEFGQFKRMLAGQTDERIFLLEAGGEWGKSELLRGVFMKYCSLTGIPHFFIDLKGSSIGLDAVLYELCNKFRTQSSRFLDLVARLARLEHGEIIGRYAIAEALKTPDEIGYTRQVVRLTEVLFNDLCTQLEQLVLIFDTYEQANDDVKRWLSELCLPYARPPTKLMIVIAGRQRPEVGSDLMAYCYPYSLKGVVDVEAWEQFAQNQGMLMPREWIEGFCVANEGRPGPIVNLLQSVHRQRGNYAR